MIEQQWERSLELLTAGDYINGWPQHEWIRTGNSDKKHIFEPTPTFGMPIWQGDAEPITLLINADFGMGDTIMFRRFMKEATKRVSRTILRCDEDFGTLFQDSVGKDQLPEFDKIIHMMALPRVLKAKISGVSYLQPVGDSQQDLSVLSQLKFLKIGVCWSGNPFNPRDAGRSIPTDVIRGLLFESGMKYFSLNKIESPPSGFLDMRGFMQDWNATAHLLSRLDLIISVDTAIAHLAGAMGKQVWLLISEEPDWRWGRIGSKTVWYDSMRIYRKQDSWSNLLQLVINDLKAATSF